MLLISRCVDFEKAAVDNKIATGTLSQVISFGRSNMPTLNKAFDDHYYIRGKDFHRLEEDDDYWTWQVHGVNSSVIVKEAGGRGVRVRDDGDRIPRSMAARIREQIWSNLGRAY